MGLPASGFGGLMEGDRPEVAVTSWVKAADAMSHRVGTGLATLARREPPAFVVWAASTSADHGPGDHRACSNEGELREISPPALNLPAAQQSISARLRALHPDQKREPPAPVPNRP